MTFLYGITTELVYRNDIKHMAYCRYDLFARGWDAGLIKHFLGTPDYQARRGHYNTGPILFWKKARVEQIEAQICDRYAATFEFNKWWWQSHQEWR
jgi:hypothetical protein